MKPIKPVILSCSGTVLTDAEKRQIAEHNPFGFILFRRNCESPEQVQKLTAEFRTLVERGDAPVLIDQEGGRVARLREPVWREFPSAITYGNYAASGNNDAEELAFEAGQQMGAQIRALGINVNCAPMVDLPSQDAHAGVIGDRVFGRDADTITRLARQYANGLISAGILPIMKHIPGHGRATADSHEELPVVQADLPTLERTDFVPFRELQLPMAMTAHVMFPAIDKTAPVTLSKTAIDTIIRGSIGFTGFLVADTLEMKALKGPLADRCRAALAAGNDAVLYCPGDVEGNEEVLAAAPAMTEKALARWARAQSFLPAHFAKFDQKAYENLTAKLSGAVDNSESSGDSVVAHL